MNKLNLISKIKKDGIINSFEIKLSELIRLHRTNIDELRYSKYNKGKFKTQRQRKVFRVVVEEFISCYHEVKRFANLYPQDKIIKDEYLPILKKILKENKCKISPHDFALLDIAFCFFYFGVSKESETVLIHKFYNRYNRHFVGRLKVFLQLKPKEEYKKGYNEWIKFTHKSAQDKRFTFENIYIVNQNPIRNQIQEENAKLYNNLKKYKYYGGHQHRLGHYFRHLFQSYKYISSQLYLSDEEKYFYGKTLRAQLSTYEQLILFFNSLSSLGMKWEYIPEKNIPKGTNLEDFKLITKYNLIKNLPGSQYYEFKYRKFYPKVDYEFKDDITYNLTQTQG